MTTVTRTISRMDGQFTATVEIDERVDLDAMMIVFAVDGDIVAPNGKTQVWADRRTVPDVGAAIRGSAIGRDGEYVVADHGWLDHNLVVVYLTEADKPETKVRARVRSVGRDMDELGAPPDGFVWVALEVPIADAKVCHGDYVEISAGVCEGDEPVEVTP